jgi:hypothetical protein
MDAQKTMLTEGRGIKSKPMYPVPYFRGGGMFKRYGVSSFVSLSPIYFSIQQYGTSKVYGSNILAFRARQHFICMGVISLSGKSL